MIVYNLDEKADVGPDYEMPQLLALSNACLNLIIY